MVLNLDYKLYYKRSRDGKNDYWWLPLYREFMRLYKTQQVEIYEYHISILKNGVINTLEYYPDTDVRKACIRYYMDFANRRRVGKELHGPLWRLLSNFHTNVKDAILDYSSYFKNGGAASEWKYSYLLPLFNAWNSARYVWKPVSTPASSETLETPINHAIGTCSDTDKEEN